MSTWVAMDTLPFIFDIDKYNIGNQDIKSSDGWMNKYMKNFDVKPDFQINM